MASNRHLGRIVALQTLYEVDFRASGLTKVSLSDVLKRNLRPYQKQIEDIEFVEKLVKGVAGAAPELDEIIAPIAPDWPVEQIARIDKIILRMALWELNNEPEIPAKVVINEAVELAKSFGGDSSSKFVNGVLGTAYKHITEKAEKAAKPKKPAQPKKEKKGTK